jgi:succinoglycan biosynthesis transport protein ExoP
MALPTEQSPAYIGESPSLNPSGFSTTAESSLSESLIILRKRKLVVIAAIAIGVAYGLYRSFTQVHMFDSSAKIEVRNGASQEYKIDPAQALQGDSTSNKMAAEIVILQSDSLMLTVAREMNLCNNAIFLGEESPVSYSSLDDLSTREKTLRRLHTELKIQLVPKTDIIRLSYSSLDRTLSADIVNRVIADYIQRSYETRYLSTQRVSQWLSGQLDDLKHQVETSQEQMLDLQRRLGMLGFDPTKNQNTTTLEGLSIAVAQAKIARILAESRYRTMETMDPNSIEDSIDPTHGAAPAALTTLRTSIATIKATLADLQANLGPNHPQVKAEKAQLAALETEQDKEQSRLLDQARENFIIAKASEDRTLASLDVQKQEAYKMRDDLVQFTLRSREFESNRTLYEGLLQRLRTAGVEAGLESLEIDIVDPAVPAAAPTLKPKSTILITAFIVSALAGMMIAFLLESLDTGLKSIADVEAVTGLPSLAIIPRYKRVAGEITDRSSIAQQNLSVLTSPKSQFAEALRSLRTSLLLSHTGKPPKLILFTSATPAEGKTTISTNTSCVLAGGGARVLLIDSDMRRPAIHPRFGLSGKVGLSTLLTGGSTFEQTIQNVAEVPTLDIIASGPVPPFPAELLGSQAMKDLLAHADKIYDYIVVDSPPILSVTDGVILARDADAVALVVRHGKSSKHIVRRARDLLTRAGAPLTGIVLNAVDMNAPDYEGYYGQSGYHYSGSDSETWEPQTSLSSNNSRSASSHSSSNQDRKV